MSSLAFSMTEGTVNRYGLCFSDTSRVSVRAPEAQALAPLQAVSAGSSRGWAHAEPHVMCMSSLVIYSTPSFCLLCHPSVEETRSFVPWNVPRYGPHSALTIAFPFVSLMAAVSSGLLCLGTADTGG